MKLSTKTKYENYRQKLNPWNQPMRLIGDKGKREKRKKLMEFCQKWVNLALFSPKLNGPINPPWIVLLIYF